MTVEIGTPALIRNLGKRDIGCLEFDDGVCKCTVNVIGEVNFGCGNDLGNHFLRCLITLSAAGNLGTGDRFGNAIGRHTKADELLFVHEFCLELTMRFATIACRGNGLRYHKKRIGKNLS